MTHYDVIVVGAGPSGSTTARKLAQQDINVLLIDKEKFPRNKPCGGGLTIRALENVDVDISSVVLQDFYGYRMHTSSGLVVESVQQESIGSLVMRKDFDNLLLTEAKKAGAVVREGARVFTVGQDAEKVSVNTGNGEILTSDYVVGADGINGVVARDLGFYDGWKGNKASVCIEIEVEVGSDAVKRICNSVEGNKSLINIYFGTSPFGYTWCFPKKDILSIGIGCRQDVAVDMASRFDKWFELFKIEHNITDAKVISNTAGRIPYSGPEKTVIGRALLVGDAAGFAMAHSGEGITNAIISGNLAASAISIILGSEIPGTILIYELLWKSQIGDDLIVGKEFADLMFEYKDNIGSVIELAAKDDYLLSLIRDLFGQTKSLKELKRAFIRRMLTRHFRKGLSLLRKRELKWIR